MEYKDLPFKIPVESPTYEADSAFVIQQVSGILEQRRRCGDNRIILNTNLKSGLPLENINKLAGPLVELWAYEVFSGIRDQADNAFSLINVEAQDRLDMADIILQFKKGEHVITGNVDVKATSDDISLGGKSPNVTSFARIRTAYVVDPDFIFVILSLRHKVYSERSEKTGLMNWIMEISGCHAYDLKYLSDADICYNPALGTGQIQVKDIHYVSHQKRTTWEMCRLLDAKYLKSKKRSLSDFVTLAKRMEWIK